VITPHRRNQLNPDGEHRARPTCPHPRRRAVPGGDALFLPAWSWSPLTATAGGCVHAVLTSRCPKRQKADDYRRPNITPRIIPTPF
jgi:hypothetical protein